MCKKMELNHQLTSYTKINLGWVKDLNISGDTRKILVANINSKISDISHSNIFANISPREGKLRKKNKQMGLHQIKKLLYG